MAAKHRNAIWDRYGKMDEDTGLDYLVCPDCDGRRFDTLAEFKSHMQRKHGGLEVSGSEVDSIETGDVTTSMTGETPQTDRTSPNPVSTTSAPKPRTLSKKARELNDKLNEAINLVIKHFVDGLTEMDTERLSVLRGEVSTAVVGVEFDFEQRLFAVSGKIALAITVGCLYVLPKLPTLKQMAAKAKDKDKKNVPTDN